MQGKNLKEWLWLSHVANGFNPPDAWLDASFKKVFRRAFPGNPGLADISRGWILSEDAPLIKSMDELTKWLSCRLTAIKITHEKLKASLAEDLDLTTAVQPPP